MHLSLQSCKMMSLPSDPNTVLLFQFSLDNSSEIDDGFVFDIHPSLLVDCRKLIIGEKIGEGGYSFVYKGWSVHIAYYELFLLVLLMIRLFHTCEHIIFV